MGNLFSKIKRLFTSDPQRLLLLGLDAAGKTTLLYKMQCGQVVTTVPTIGFNVEQVEFGKSTFTVWDVGGQEKIRPLWRHYYMGTDALIYVVDSTDKERLEESAEELHKILLDPSMTNIKGLLVFANKQDLKSAADARTVAKAMALDKLKVASLVQPCSATKGDGIYEGLEWLAARCKRAKL